MPRFFHPGPIGEELTLTGEDARHIARSLRMSLGDPLTVCDGNGQDYAGTIVAFTTDSVTLNITESAPCPSEPSVRMTLYQALPKGDKLDLIVQKAVELGVHAVVPVLTKRCISRPDTAGMEKKRARLQKVALEAAKQCGRGIIPQVRALLSFEDAVREMSGAACPILFYESNGATLRDCLTPVPAGVALMIGSEGGFDEQEILLAQRHGIPIVHLGPRILRCETAPLCALSAILFATGNLE